MSEHYYTSQLGKSSKYYGGTNNSSLYGSNFGPVFADGPPPLDDTADEDDGEIVFRNSQAKLAANPDSTSSARLNHESETSEGSDSSTRRDKVAGIPSSQKSINWSNNDSSVHDNGDDEEFGDFANFSSAFSGDENETGVSWGNSCIETTCTSVGATNQSSSPANMLGKQWDRNANGASDMTDKRITSPTGSSGFGCFSDSDDDFEEFQSFGPKDESREQSRHIVALSNIGNKNSEISTKGGQDTANDTNPSNGFQMTKSDEDDLDELKSCQNIDVKDSADDVLPNKKVLSVNNDPKQLSQNIDILDDVVKKGADLVVGHELINVGKEHERKIQHLTVEDLSTANDTSVSDEFGDFSCSAEKSQSDFEDCSASESILPNQRTLQDAESTENNSEMDKRASIQERPDLLEKQRLTGDEFGDFNACDLDWNEGCVDNVKDAQTGELCSEEISDDSLGGMSYSEEDFDDEFGNFASKETKKSAYSINSNPNENVRGDDRTEIKLTEEKETDKDHNCGAFDSKQMTVKSDDVDDDEFGDFNTLSCNSHSASSTSNVTAKSESNEHGCSIRSGPIDNPSIIKHNSQSQESLNNEFGDFNLSQSNVKDGNDFSNELHLQDQNKGFGNKDNTDDDFGDFGSGFDSTTDADFADFGSADKSVGFADFSTVEKSSTDFADFDTAGKRTTGFGDIGSDKSSTGFADFNTAENSSTVFADLGSIKRSTGVAGFSSTEKKSVHSSTWGTSSRGSIKLDWPDTSPAGSSVKQTTAVKETPVLQQRQEYDKGELSIFKPQQNMMIAKVNGPVVMCFRSTGVIPARGIFVQVLQQKMQANENSMWEQLNISEKNGSIRFDWVMCYHENKMLEGLTMLPVRSQTSASLQSGGKSSIPLFAAGMGLLEPMKGVISPSHHGIQEINPTQDPFGAPPDVGLPSLIFGNSKVALSKAADIKDNSLDTQSESSSLDLDFLLDNRTENRGLYEEDLLGLGMQFSDSSSATNSPKLPEGKEAKKVFKFGNVTISLGADEGTADLSNPAKKIVNDFEDLSFMLSKVLMFPFKSN